MIMNAELEARRLVRRIAKCGNERQPVVVVDEDGGKDSVGFTGSSWHYQTRGGNRILHPGAYSRSGWSNMVYVPSSRQLEVGKDFYNFLVRWVS
jgi:hypothetical protein